MLQNNRASMGTSKKLKVWGCILYLPHTLLTHTFEKGSSIQKAELDFKSLALTHAKQTDPQMMRHSYF